MFKHYLKGIDGIQQYPLLLLVLFFLFFIAMLIYLWKTDRSFFDEMGEMPLHDTFHPNQSSTQEKKTGV